MSGIYDTGELYEIALFFLQPDTFGVGGLPVYSTMIEGKLVDSESQRGPRRRSLWKVWQSKYAPQSGIDATRYHREAIYSGVLDALDAGFIFILSTPAGDGALVIPLSRCVTNILACSRLFIHITRVFAIT